MVKRASDVIGKPVVSADSGEKLGTVADLLLDDGQGQLVGLVVHHGWRNEERVIPAAAVQTFGADAVVSRSTEFMHMKEWRERERDSSSLPQDQGHPQHPDERGRLDGKVR